MRLNRTTVGATLVSVAVLAGMWSSLRGDADSPTNHSAQPSPVSACSLTVGDRFAFEVSAKSRYRIDPTALLGAEAGAPETPSSTKVLDAQMLWHVLARPEPDTWTIAAKLHAPIISVDDERLDTADGQFEQPVMFRMRRDCTIAAMAAPIPEASPSHQELQLLLLLAEMSASSGVEPRWTAMQTDTVGTYRATYARDRSGADIARVRERYTSLQLAQGHDQGASLTANIMASNAEATIAGPGQWFSRLTAREHVRLSTPTAVFVDADTRLELEQVAAPEDDAFWTRTFDLSAATWKPATMLLAPPADTSELAIDVQGRPLPDIVAEFSSLLESGEDPNHHQALSVMVSYLRLDPGHPQRLIEMLRDASDMSEQVRSMAFLALELTGSGAAHEALLAAVNDPSLSNNDRLRAVVAYRDARGANDAFVGNLSDILASSRSSGDRDLESAALLGIGALGQHPDLTAQGRESVRGILHTELARAETSDRAVDALGAVGNSKDASFAEAVRSHADADDAHVRAAAYDALDSIGATPPAQELFDVLMADGSGAVQEIVGRQLVRSASSLDERLVVDLADTLSGDIAPLRRTTLIEALGANVARVPEARAALWGHLSAETDPQMLRLIGRYLPAIDPQADRG